MNNRFCLLFEGFIGKIKLQIPVSRMKSEPWVISMEKLYLVAGPLTHKKVLVLSIYIQFLNKLRFPGICFEFLVTQ